MGQMTPEGAAQFAEEVAKITEAFRERRNRILRNRYALQRDHEEQRGRLQDEMAKLKAQMEKLDADHDADQEDISKTMMEVRNDMHTAIDVAHSKYCTEEKADE